MLRDKLDCDQNGVYQLLAKQAVTDLFGVAIQPLLNLVRRAMPPFARLPYPPAWQKAQRKRFEKCLVDILRLKYEAQTQDLLREHVISMPETRECKSLANAGTRISARLSQFSLRLRDPVTNRLSDDKRLEEAAKATFFTAASIGYIPRSKKVKKDDKKGKSPAKRSDQALSVGCQPFFTCGSALTLMTFKSNSTQLIT